MIYIMHHVAWITIGANGADYAGENDPTLRGP